MYLTISFTTYCSRMLSDLRQPWIIYQRWKFNRIVVKI